MRNDYEQLSLFCQKPRYHEPPKPQPNSFEGKYWRPKDYYRYNERHNSDPAGWVRITREYVGYTYHADGKLFISFWTERSSAGTVTRISREDLEQYFEQIQRPEWMKGRFEE